MRVVVAPDKFKGSLTASQVAGAVATGLRRVVHAAAGERAAREALATL